MNVIIKKDYEKMSDYAAEVIAQVVRSKPDCVLGLATGSTPRGTYAKLAIKHKQGLDFSRVKTFNLDEYLGLEIELHKPYAFDQSYARFMHEEFFKHVNIRKENIHLPKGRAEDPRAFCTWYEQEIKKAGGIDLQLLGIGGDGHWAFNEPGSSLSSRTRVIDLSAQTIDDNYESFYKRSGIEKGKMPRQAITMGIGTILESKQLLMIANGEKKAAVVAKALQGPVTSEITASAIQLFKGRAFVVVDESAGAQLKSC